MARLPKDNILPIQRITIRNSEKINFSRNTVLCFLGISKVGPEDTFLHFVNTSKEWEYMSFIITGNPEGEVTKGLLGNLYKLVNGEVFKISENELGNLEELSAPISISDEEDGPEEDLEEGEEDLGPSPSFYPEGSENNEYEILNGKTKKELFSIASDRGIRVGSRDSKEILISKILED